jgi:hypothetical protein
VADLIVTDASEVDSGSGGGSTPDTPAAPNDTSVPALIEQVWSYLYTGVRVERDKLDGAVIANATELVTTYQRGGIKAGARLSIDLEDYHVWSVADETVTVQPGEFGSTATEHADGSIIHVNAEWSPFEIFREMNNELRALSHHLAYTRTVTLTYNPAYVGYDLTDVTNVDGIVGVLAQDFTSRNWFPITGWRVDHNLDTDVFASGSALFTHDGVPGRDLLVTYRAHYTPLTGLTNYIASQSGLPYSAHDILAMGAAVRCAAPAEIDRNQMGSQGSGRRSNEVPAGARLNAIRGLAQLRQTRIIEERDRLARKFPVRLVRRY